MRTKLHYILILLSAANIFAQPFGNISVITDKGIKDIPSYNREKTVYFSIRDFADAASINYFYNKKNGKIELKFDDYLLKITAKNPYFVITLSNALCFSFDITFGLFLSNVTFLK